MLDVLTGFVGELRAAGLPVSLTETLDAAEAVHHIPLEDRDALKYALAATLVKTSTHWKAFETAFEVYFSMRGPQYDIDDDEPRPATPTPTPTATSRGRGEGQGPGRRRRRGAVARGAGRDAVPGPADRPTTPRSPALARQAVSRFAGMEPGRPVGAPTTCTGRCGTSTSTGVLERLMEAARAEAPEGQLTPLEERLARDEFQARLDRLRQEIEDEIRRRLVADRGTEALARSLRKPLPEDIDFMHATREELASLRRAIHPLTRKLAVRLARKRRHGRKGPLDFRSTVRHSLSTGGVPVDPKFRYPRPAKPEIIVIADISGSVAAFARFTLHLVYAISSQFSKVRSFVFIDGIDEVTRFFEGVEDVAEAVHRINTEADVVWVDGHSDYGHALSVFWERWGEEITPRTSVLLLGDARNNYHASQAWVVQEIRHRARHVYWLNPEPRAYWGTGDSIVGEYAVHCDGVFECRNLRQLEQFVTELA